MISIKPFYAWDDLPATTEKFLLEFGKFAKKRLNIEDAVTEVTWNHTYTRENSSSYGDVVLTLRHHHYLINLRSDMCLIRALWVLSHELIHVEQYESRKLINLDWGYRLFKHKKYNNSMPYASKPWEIDAKRRSKQLVIAYRDAVSRQTYDILLEDYARAKASGNEP